jgi:hypothetical protein
VSCDVSLSALLAEAVLSARSDAIIAADNDGIFSVLQKRVRKMRITMEGWLRNHGETEITNVALTDAIEPPGPGAHYSTDQAYLRVEHPYFRTVTKANVSAATEQLRLGGRYLIKVELSRNEIAKLFFATHHGDIVRMFRQLLEDEERQEEEEERQEDAARRLISGRRERLAAKLQKQELLKQFGDRLSSLNERDGTARATSEAKPEPE